jgi:uncharacterized protein YkwD
VKTRCGIVILLVALAALVFASLPAAAPASVSLTVLERDVLACVNAERVARGLAPVRPQADLMCAARAHSRSMAHQSYFSHSSLSGASFALRLLGFGYERDGFASWSVGENIARARFGTVAATPQGVVLLWMQSPGHRAVILNKCFRDAGIGIHREGGWRYFTLDLGRRAR